jgi:hypothetical protein
MRLLVQSRTGVSLFSSQDRRSMHRKQQAQHTAEGNKEVRYGVNKINVKSLLKKNFFFHSNNFYIGLVDKQTPTKNYN